MSTHIAGHKLTRAEVETLDAVQAYCRTNAGDSHWSNSTSPKGDGRAIPVREIFPARDNADNARCRTVTRLAENGILKACEIEYKDGLLRGRPLHAKSDSEELKTNVQP